MAAIAPSPAVHAFKGKSSSMLLGLLRLLRPANLVTSAADILAAAVVVSAPAHIFGWLVGASVCMYAGGVVLNDFFDRRLDAYERPERPLPSGAIAAPAAAVLGFALLLLGVALACAVSPRSGLLAAILAGAVLAYDAWAKRHGLGPVVMGLCRALNLLLGLSAVPAALLHLWPLALLPLVYIAAITALSHGEVHGGSRATSGMILLLVLCVLLAVFALPFVLGRGNVLALSAFAAFFAMRVLPPLWRAWQQPTAMTIRAGVHAGIVSLIVLDASLAAAFGGWVMGAAILSMSVVSAELARFFAVT